MENRVDPRIEAHISRVYFCGHSLVRDLPFQPTAEILPMVHAFIKPYIYLFRKVALLTMSANELKKKVEMLEGIRPVPGLEFSSEYIEGLKHARSLLLAGTKKMNSVEKDQDTLNDVTLTLSSFIQYPGENTPNTDLQILHSLEKRSQLVADIWNNELVPLWDSLILNITVMYRDAKQNLNRKVDWKSQTFYD